MALYLGFFFLIFRSWFFDFPDPCQLPIGEGLGVVIGPLFYFAILTVFNE